MEPYRINTRGTISEYVTIEPGIAGVGSGYSEVTIASSKDVDEISSRIDYLMDMISELTTRIDLLENRQGTIEEQRFDSQLDSLLTGL